jgi:hypothetical protein
VASYLTWNDALAEHFFRPEMAERQVWLYVNDDVISEIAAQLNEDSADFVASVKHGPLWVTARGLCQQALQAMSGWRDRGLDYPPYIGYLALFVLAAGLEGDFAPHAYYPRLRHLLGDPTSDALPSFERMLELWDDLERWSIRDRQGALGVFVARIVGGWIHVGLPVAQTILSEQERRALTQVFALADFDPTSPPPDDELVRALRVHGQHLRPRTRTLVGTRGDNDNFAVLIDAVGDELADWDGTAYDDGALSAGARQPVRIASLRLCARVERSASRLSLTLRCRLKREFPEDGLVLKGDGFAHLSCDETVPGWSSQLVDATDGQTLDASTVDWTDGISLQEARLGWRFRFPGRRVRILVEGGGDGLPGLVETRQLPRGQRFSLLFRSADWPLLTDWTEHECDSFERVSIREGVPDGWEFASCKQTTGDSRVRSHFPELALSEHIRLTFVGGIRSAPGFNFFGFAPPDVSLEGGTGAEKVMCGGNTLSPIGESTIYSLPRNLPRETSIVIEVVREGVALKRHTIYLTGDFDWRGVELVHGYNNWGEPDARGDGARIAGALNLGLPIDASPFRAQALLAPGIAESNTPHVFLLGRMPGQFACWPDEEVPTRWDPVWAVPMSRKGRAIYCGGSVDQAVPLARNDAPDDSVTLWKDILWRKRKRITPPPERCLLELWKAYIEAASRV